MTVKLAVIYYSSTGTTYQLAQAITEGANNAGAEVRLLKVRELAPEDAINTNPKWVAHLKDTAEIPEATLDDLEWADALIFGTPTRYGLPSAQLKQFIDSTASLWLKGALADKIGSSFTTTASIHGGHESTLLAINNLFYHWGAIIVSPGYTDPIQFQSGNPYGTSFAGNNEHSPDAVALAAARFQGKRVTEITARFLRGRE